MNRKHNSALTENARVLRKNVTKEERHLWYDFLSTYEVRFQRQKVIDNFIVDFYCHKAKLIIELDGSGHYESENLIKDQIRTDYFHSLGLKVLRFTNIEVTREFKAVCEAIDETVKRLTVNRG